MKSVRPVGASSYDRLWFKPIEEPRHTIIFGCINLYTLDKHLYDALFLLIGKLIKTMASHTGKLKEMQAGDLYKGRERIRTTRDTLLDVPIVTSLMTEARRPFLHWW